jgi:YfiH family protein
MTPPVPLDWQRHGDLLRYWLPALPVWHGFFTRDGGFSREPYRSLNTAFVTQDAAAPRNRQKLFETLAIGDRVRILNPCHGEQTAFVDAAAWAAERQAVLIKTDAAFSRERGSHLLVSTADCIPAVVTDTAGSFVGLVHLGWRNLVADLTGKVLTAVQAQYGVAMVEVVIGIGPAIYPCCYVFQDPVQKDQPFWQPFLRAQGNGRYGIDLVGAFRAQLAGVGVRPEHIHEAGLCTACRNELFFSCYKEGYVSGRFPTVVGLR